MAHVSVPITITTITTPVKRIRSRIADHMAMPVMLQTPQIHVRPANALLHVIMVMKSQMANVCRQP